MVFPKFFKVVQRMLLTKTRGMTHKNPPKKRTTNVANMLYRKSQLEGGNDPESGVKDDATVLSLSNNYIQHSINSKMKPVWNQGNWLSNEAMTQDKNMESKSLNTMKPIETTEKVNK